MLWTAPAPGHRNAVDCLSQAERFKEVRQATTVAFEVEGIGEDRRGNADKVDPGIGTTRVGQRIFECVLLIGTRSAQSIMASGFTAAQTGRTHDRTRPMLQQLRKFLPRRRRPHMTQSGHGGGHAFVAWTFQEPFELLLIGRTISHPRPAAPQSRRILPFDCSLMMRPMTCVPKPWREGV